MIRDKYGRLAIFKRGGKKIVPRLRKIESYGHTPKVYDYKDGFMILEYIEGINWKIYLDKNKITDDLAHWYILENQKIYNDIGGHGDYVWYNVIMTPDKQLKWIDLGVGDNDRNEFINQLCMHLYKKYTKEYIIEFIANS